MSRDPAGVANGRRSAVRRGPAVDGEAARGRVDELLKGETTAAEATRRYGFGPFGEPRRLPFLPSWARFLNTVAARPTECDASARRRTYPKASLISLPPATGSVTPVMKLAASESRKTAAWPISSG